MGYLMRKYPVGYLLNGDVDSPGPVGIKCNWRLTHDAHTPVRIFNITVSLIKVYAEVQVRRVHIQYPGYPLNYSIYPVFCKYRVFLGAFAGKTESASYASIKAVKLLIARIVYRGILCLVGFSRLLRLKDAGRAGKEKKSQIKGKEV